MAKLSAARAAALALVGRRRRQNGRIRDLARTDEGLEALSPADRALAFRLALGETAAEQVLDELIDGFLRKPRGVEPRVRDALRLAGFEICYLETPAAVAASQGVELVRSVSPRAAGLANAVLRRMANEVRPRVEEARAQVASQTASVEELSLASGLPLWLVGQVLADRGAAFASALCADQLEGAPVCVAGNAQLHAKDEVRDLLERAGLHPRALAGLAGSYLLEQSSATALSSLVEHVDVAVADLSSQLVCRIAAAEKPGTLLEIGQGRGTKSLLLAAAMGAVWPTRIDAVDTVSYKVELSRRRMARAGLADVVFCHELDGRLLNDKEALPAELAGLFDTVLLDAPCSGTGTMRRHPETAAALAERDVEELARLQGELLAAAAARVTVGGTLVYATCSVLRAEDEEVVERFLASPAGQPFVVESASGAPACAANPELRNLVTTRETPEGYLLVTPAGQDGDGHFCVRMRRR